jgi:hypothetical protein
VSAAVSALALLWPDVRCACSWTKPTSGLDSSSALSLFKLLKELAAGGLTVVAVVHQPRMEVFAATDDLIVLGLWWLPVLLRSFGNSPFIFVIADTAHAHEISRRIQTFGY